MKSGIEVSSCIVGLELSKVNGVDGGFTIFELIVELGWISIRDVWEVLLIKSNKKIFAAASTRRPMRMTVLILFVFVLSRLIFIGTSRLTR